MAYLLPEVTFLKLRLDVAPVRQAVLPREEKNNKECIWSNSII